MKAKLFTALYVTALATSAIHAGVMTVKTVQDLRFERKLKKIAKETA